VIETFGDDATRCPAARYWIKTERKGLIIQLIGCPGVGKYTIAQEIVAQLAARGEVARRIDNHLTANLITDLVADPYVDGVLIDAARERIAQVRSILDRTLEEVSPPDWTFVFTNFRMIGYPHEAIFRNRELARQRGSTFLPILLSCRFDELMRRVESPLRTGKHNFAILGRLASSTTGECSYRIGLNLERLT
jgi:hypothetical protein